MRLIVGVAYVLVLLSAVSRWPMVKGEGPAQVRPFPEASHHREPVMQITGVKGEGKLEIGSRAYQLEFK